MEILEKYHEFYVREDLLSSEMSDADGQGSAVLGEVYQS